MSGVFEELHVVVTGGTGALGGAVTDLLLELGAICHLPVRRAAGSRFDAVPPNRLRVTVGIDLSNEQAVRDYYAGINPLWASIHCAGAFAAAPLAASGAELASRMWSVNFLSAFACCREATAAIRREGRGGRLVNVAARPALRPHTGGGMSAYAASKAAVAALTGALAAELAGDGIKVNAIAPSVLDTAENRRAMPDADFERWPKLQDAARIIATLAAPDNGAINGAIVPLYGRA